MLSNQTASDNNLSLIDAFKEAKKADKDVEEQCNRFNQLYNYCVHAHNIKTYDEEFKTNYKLLFQSHSELMNLYSTLIVDDESLNQSLEEQRRQPTGSNEKGNRRNHTDKGGQ